jgi:hypothetical protein
MKLVAEQSLRRLYGLPIGGKLNLLEGFFCSVELLFYVGST